MAGSLFMRVCGALSSMILTLRRLRRRIEDAWQRHDNAGKVLGTVELVDCVQDSRSAWAIDGYWHWILRDPRPYARPVPAKSQLGLWEWHR